MIIAFEGLAWDDYLHWQFADRRMLSRINGLIRDISRNPYEGPGKPEPLRNQWAGWWSRRIDSEHRLVYRVVGDQIRISQCRYHYQRE